MRAIVRLQFAYQMNLSELHENGRIQYNNSDGELISIESFEKLTSIDHAQLATKATGGDSLSTPSIPEIIWVKNVRAIVVCGFLMK